MKKLIVILGIFCASTIFLHEKVSADTLIPLALNEFLPDPDGADSGKEWVELYNNSNSDINLTNYIITTRALTGSTIRSTTIPSGTIKANSFFLIVEDPLLFSGTNKVSVGSGKLNMYNSDSEIILKDNSGNILDQLQYLGVQSGLSFERKGPANNVNCKNLLKNPTSNSIGLHNFNYDPLCWNIVLPVIQSISLSTDQVNWSGSFSAKGPVNLYF
jgi:hypothetical protein